MPNAAGRGAGGSFAISETATYADYIFRSGEDAAARSWSVAGRTLPRPTMVVPSYADKRSCTERLGQTAYSLLGVQVGDRQFKSWRSYWQFEVSVRTANRFFRTREAATFLNTVLETSKPFNETWKAGIVLWRAQLGCDWRSEPMGEGKTIRYPYQYSPDRMLPLRDAASEGRANPKGIPYLYVATDRDTALAEVRPWVGSFISAGEFVVLEDLKIVNFALREDARRGYKHDPSPEERTATVWVHIDEAFSRPVTPSDAVADYAPTQVIAEMFRKAGFDGIAYHSALGQGLNAALFDIDSVRLRICQLFKAESLSFTFRAATSPYSVPGEQEDSGEDA